MDRERHRGCILGLAIGDALGMPTEFLTLEDIRRRFGPQGVHGFEAGQWRAGCFTDDTQMTLALAEAILAAGRDASVDEVMAEVTVEFVHWMKEPPGAHRAPGNTCLTGCRNLAAGVPWRQAGVADSKGCGSAMRAAPIGLAWPGDYARVCEVAIAQSLATHGHPAALEGEEPEAMLDRVIAPTGDISDEFVAQLAVVREVLHAREDEAWRQLGRGWVAEEAVAGALYCFLRSPNDCRATVLRAANTDRDSDSLACIAGAISGAHNGIDAIPEEWRDRVERVGYLTDVAHRLYAFAR